MAVRTLEETRRFAELAARTGLEPELAHRYATDPVAVLAEFGVSTTEPLYLVDSAMIEDLDGPDVSAVAAPTLFSYAPDPDTASVTVD